MSSIAAWWRSKAAAGPARAWVCACVLALGAGCASGRAPAASAPAGRSAWEPFPAAQAPEQYNDRGPFEATRFEESGARIRLVVPAREPFSVERAALVEWVRAGAKTVARYFGRPPVREFQVIVLPRGSRGIGLGTAYNSGWIRFWLGPKATAQELRDDWEMTHEIFHLGFPTIEGDQRWLEEGMATYLEGIARVRDGRRSEADLWSFWLERAPHGLPEEGDEGLEKTRTWGNTYWGGFLFWFLADLEIRERSAGKKSLDDAMRAILAAGGDMRAEWSIERVVATGDRATGLPVLRELRERMGRRPIQVDLPALWKKLGISRAPGTSGPAGIRLDDRAPWAPIRRALLK